MAELHASQDHGSRRSATGALARGLSALGVFLIFTTLAAIFFWFGATKFAAYEAEAIAPLVENSPALARAYDYFSVQGLSNAIGAFEIFIGLLIVGRIVSPLMSFFGGLLAAGLFAVTLSFLATTPGVIEQSVGFPALTGSPGQFLLKDIVLLAASVFVAGRSLAALDD